MFLIKFELTKLSPTMLGVDAAPYFRIFNPTTQALKFDKNLKYINKWVEDLNDLNYPDPIVDHKFARQRCLETYKKGLE